MAVARTLRRIDLSEAINIEIGLSRAESAILVEAILGYMSTALTTGDNVKITGFGSFNLRDKPARLGRNPITGTPVTIGARRVLTFRPSPNMSTRIAGAG